jgi:hypothetical protein
MENSQLRRNLRVTGTSRQHGAEVSLLSRVLSRTKWYV